MASSNSDDEIDYIDFEEVYGNDETVPMVHGGAGGGGNTKPPQKRDNAAKKWCFTLNNYNSDEYETLVHLGREITTCFIIGKEVGKNGTPHLQGYWELKKRMRLSALKKLNERIHWERTKGSREQNIAYCSKEGDYVGENIKIEKPTKPPLKLITTLYPYQLQIEEIVKSEPDDRTIYWIYEPIGNVGKTQLCKYLSAKYNAVPIEGKKNDILFCAATFESNCYLYDIERDLEEYVSYGAIEKLKNGYYMCSKYESKPIVRNSPHVFIFANFLPRLDSLSKDRWIIYKVPDIDLPLERLTESDIEYEMLVYGKPLAP